ncbi:MAG: HlyD family type I secretion periplasmic adaptor subunit [Alphaproteobacteria bacterium]
MARRPMAQLSEPDGTVGVDRAALWRDLRPVIIAGTVVVGVFFVGFGGWAALAPLASAAIAPGIVSPDGSRKTVQHLEGGIIRDIRVKNDEMVKTGDVLVVLEDTQARAGYDLLQTQHDALAAHYARLSAEQIGADSLVFPEDLLARAQARPQIADLVQGQRQFFTVRKQSLEERKAILGQQIRQLGAQITGLRDQIKARDREVALIKDEIVQVADLLKRGYERKPRLLALQRREAQIEGERAEHMGDIARARQTIDQAKLEIVNLETARQDEIAAEITRVRTELLAMQERLLASRDVLRRTEVVAPVDGRVVELRFKTSGGVVGPGEPILDIVPIRDELLVDARVSPLDIDVVRPGLEARVHLLAYRQRSLPQIGGIVRQVSADSILDQATGQRYFLARIEVDPDGLATLPEGVPLSAGMPAEVLIKTGERTLLNYLIEPLLDSVRRSFRED